MVLPSQREATATSRHRRSGDHAPAAPVVTFAAVFVLPVFTQSVQGHSGAATCHQAWTSHDPDKGHELYHLATSSATSNPQGTGRTTRASPAPPGVPDHCHPHPAEAKTATIGILDRKQQRFLTPVGQQDRLLHADLLRRLHHGQQDQ